MTRGICRILIVAVLLGVGCTQPPPGKGQGEIAAARHSSGGAVQFRVETVASGLKSRGRSPFRLMAVSFSRNAQAKCG